MRAEQRLHPPKFFTSQEQVDQAKCAWRDYLAGTGPFQNVPCPSKDALVKDVVECFQTGQPSWLIRDLGLHFATLVGSQGMSERCWATDPHWPSIPCQKKLNIAANWRLLFPALSPRPQVKKHRQHEFGIPALLGRRAGPSEASPPNQQGGALSCSSSTSSSSSSSTNVPEIPEKDKGDGLGRDELVDAMDASNVYQLVLSGYTSCQSHTPSL